jgi:hypothetical protein
MVEQEAYLIAEHLIPNAVEGCSSFPWLIYNHTGLPLHTKNPIHTVEALYIFFG